MEIIDNRAVKLRVRKPDRITEVIPKSKVLSEDDGVYEVLVHWGLEEMQVLKNLGVKNVPSPILGRYNWPGMYKPFEHQLQTAAFLTMHRRAYCLNEMGCVDSETEYLSPTGWVKISEYAGGEVAQYHPDSRAIEFVAPIEYVKKPCAQMIRFKTSRGVDQLLSPEHRMIIHDKESKTGKWVVQSAEEMLVWYESKLCGVSIPKSRNRVGIHHAAIPATYGYSWGTGLSWLNSGCLANLRLQVAVIADGHFPSNNERCIVRLKKDRKIRRLRDLLHEAIISYTEKEAANGFHVFTFIAPVRDKKFDAKYWNCTQEEIDIIYDEVLHWDGSFSTGNRFARFSSTEKESADFIQAVFNSKGHICGLSANYNAKYTNGVCYEVSIRNKDKGLLHILGNNTDKQSVTIEPSTDGFKYCFSVPSTFLLFRRNGCVFASGNTGKSCSALWAADYLMSKGLVRRVLVVCPLSIMDSAWRADAFKSVMHRTVDIAHGARDKRKKIIASDTEIIIINYDGIEIVAEDIARSGFDLIIIDEYNHYKNAQSKRWKVMNTLIKNDTWLWGMTGSPASQSPLDAYGLAKLMNPSSVPKFYGAFRDSIMTKITQFKYIPKLGAEDMVHKLLQPAIRYTKEDCLDLPEMLYTTREVPLTPQQNKYYKQLKEQMLIEAAGEEVTAVNAAVNLSKLLQIASGSIYTNNKEVLEFDASNRLNALEEIIDESSHKVLVFANFRHGIEMIQRHLAQQGYSVDVIHGGVPVGVRTDVFNRFQTTNAPRILVIQPQSAAHGVTLTAANTIVWFGPVTSYETYVQANARVHRAGQKNSCMVVHLTGSPVEDKLYRALEQKERMQDSIMSLYEEEIRGGK